MINEARLALHNLHHDSKEKTTHFLMARAGASIGFAISLKEALPFAWPDVLIIAAIVCWAGSFFAGIRSTEATRRVISTNSLALETLHGYEDEAREQIKAEMIQPTYDKFQGQGRFWSEAQLYSLLLGAFLIMCWRIAAAYPDFHPSRWV